MRQVKDHWVAGEGIKPLRKFGQSVGADEMGPECKVTGSPLCLACHQAHGSDSIDVEGQDEDI